MAAILPAPGQATEDAEEEAEERPLPLKEAHIDALREGGYILFLRHAEREQGIPAMELIDLAEHVPGIDRPPDDMPGHCLTEAGKESAKVLGQLFGKLEIPVGAVYSSPICRAVQTARLAFDRVDERVAVLSFIHHNYGDEEDVERHGKRLRQFFRDQLQTDSNVVMSSHGNMLRSLDVEYDDLEELGFMIFDSDLELVARANPGELAALIYSMEVPPDATRDLPEKQNTGQ